MLGSLSCYSVCWPTAASHASHSFELVTGRVEQHAIFFPSTRSAEREADPRRLWRYGCRHNLSHRSPPEFGKRTGLYYLHERFSAIAFPWPFFFPWLLFLDTDRFSKLINRLDVGNISGSSFFSACFAFFFSYGVRGEGGGGGYIEMKDRKKERKIF